MPKMQSFNRRIKAYVKYDMTRSGPSNFDVKQREPLKPFKGVKIRRKR